MKDSHKTGDVKLDRKILYWKIVLEAYTAVVVTLILLSLKGVL